ncbi:citrate synthase [bacterium]|nr:citrate synthase [bacterium]
MSGLDDVVAAETEMSSVDGANGRLIIRGYSLEQLAGEVPFESVCQMLFEGCFDNLPAPDGFHAALGAARARVAERVFGVDADIARLPPMDAVRALVARFDDDDTLDNALMLLAAQGVLLPAVLRIRKGEQPIAPDETLGHAADMLRMLGADASPEAAAALDVYLVTVSDHGLNASTFAARVVASTWAGLTSSVLAGLSALKGPLHGGAPGPVITMLDGIGEAGNAVAWIEEALDRGDRLMGFGHRIYKVRDPRANALKRAVARLAAGSPAGLGRLELAEAVELAALDVLHRRKPDLALDVNVEFYTALLLERLGFPPDAFTAVFAAGRTAGWIAHAREQRLKGRLIRPASRYVGPAVRAA